MSLCLQSYLEIQALVDVFLLILLLLVLSLLIFIVFGVISTGFAVAGFLLADCLAASLFAVFLVADWFVVLVLTVHVLAFSLLADWLSVTWFAVLLLAAVATVVSLIEDTCILLYLTSINTIFSEDSRPSMCTYFPSCTIPNPTRYLLLFQGLVTFSVVYPIGVTKLPSYIFRTVFVASISCWIFVR